MGDLLLRYRECGAETREDYLRELANDNGLPFNCGADWPTAWANARNAGRCGASAKSMGVRSYDRRACCWHRVARIARFNHRWQLTTVGKIRPADAETRYYAVLDDIPWHN